MFFTFIALLFLNITTPPSECMSSEENELYMLINDYRKTKNLAPIPYSEKLNKVARAHAWDLSENYDFDPAGECNPHSWSTEGNWSSCCYTSDHAQAECMWNKPMEIAGYKGSGYEIAFYNSNKATPEKALSGWKSSKGHNPLLINSGMWKQVNWKAVGIGIYKNYAIVWFGEVADPTSPEICP